MTSKQKSVDQFKNVTGASDSVATECLKKFNYNVQRAINHYYTNMPKSPPPAPVAKGDKAKLGKIFDKYSGASGDEKDSMFEEKLQEFWKELKIEPDGVGPYVVAWKLNAAAPGEFSRHEFLKGWSEMSIDTVAAMKTKVQELIKSLSDRATFKEFYRWLFNFAKENPEAKTIEGESAIELWTIVLKEQWPLVDKWCRFIQGEVEKAKKKEGGMKAVSRDVWDQCLEFSREIRPDLSNWEDDGAWPVIIDEFVEFVNTDGGKKKKEKEKPKTLDD